ncbi:unnamed protein product [Prorocentrum cordatum]|uniref:RNase H type-1 domain-containing protein n=1 Tax=Prorocentrum cordatum TaxID=2364126 RepID=A0ABN9QKX3_9DINO|nr:unnamed protein product [Polarella glacialis]
MMTGPFMDINGGELSALLATLRYAVPPVTAVVDSKFVFLGLTVDGRERTCSYVYAWSHLWREVWRLVDEFGGLCAGGLTIRWVKAHCTRRQILDGVVSYRDWYGNRLADQAAKSAAAHARLPHASRLKLLQSEKMVEGVAMWLSAVGSAVGGADTTHRKGKANRPAPRAVAAAPAAPPLQCQLRGPAGKRWCAVCRWVERKSACPGSIVAAALDLNAAHRSGGLRPHRLARVRPHNERQMVREMPVVACLTCGALGSRRASSFARECLAPSAKATAALTKLADGKSPHGDVAIELELL